MIDREKLGKLKVSKLIEKKKSDSQVLRHISKFLQLKGEFKNKIITISINLIVKNSDLLEELFPIEKAPQDAL